MRAALVAAMFGCVGLGGCVIYLNPLCTDQIRNGDETGVDCGGPCGKCDLGDGCRVDADCDEGNCVGGTCTPFPCDNGVQDGQETDVDCGGGPGGDGQTCRPCAGGRHCAAATDCFSGTCAPGSNTCASLATVSFADQVSYPSGEKTYALFAGDLNGDGHLDLAAANEQASEIRVFINDGGGAFQRLPAPFTTGAYPTGGTIEDFNGDGRLDVVTADYHGNSVSVLLNDGTGTGALSPRATYPTIAGAETSNLAVGDLNNDGNLDVIATNPQKASVSEFLGQGGGTLGPAIDVPVGISGASEPYSAAIRDFNGDGNNDVAIADERSGTIIVRLGNGDGTFQAEVPYPVRGTRDYILIAHDMNGDTRFDLVCANRGSDDVSVLLGRGDGTFRKAIVSPLAPSMGPYTVAVADFNQDGVPDVVTANYKTNDATILLGIGDGHFEPVLDVGPTGNNPYGVAAGDFNGDGKADFATANAVSFDVTVKLNTSR